MKTFFLILISCYLCQAQVGLMDGYNFLDGTGTTLKNNKNLPDGIIVNGTWGVQGKYLSFSGTGYINLGMSSTYQSYNYNNSFSFKVVFSTTAANSNRIVGLAGSSGVLNQIDIELYLTQLYTTFRATGIRGYNAGPALNDGKWHILTYTYQAISQTLILYVDANIVSNTTSPAYTSTFYGVNPLMGLGGMYYNNDWIALYTGKLAGFYSYSGVINAGQVSTDYTQFVQQIY